MLLVSFQYAIVASAALYFGCWRFQQHWFRAQSFESLVATLPPTPPDISSLGARAAYKYGGVLLRIADYADFHGNRIDPAIAMQLQSDALRIRFAALSTLFRMR